MSPTSSAPLSSADTLSQSLVESTTSTQSQPPSASDSTTSPSDDLLGVTSGQTLPATDRGDAPLSGDIERQSGTNDNTPGGYL